MRTALAIAAVFLLGFGTATRAAELGGVSLPDVQEAGGTRLLLNGAALRTFSFLGVRIYVAGLYLPRKSSDARAVLASGGPELLRFVFLRDVGQDTARRSWRNSLGNACPDPCAVPHELIERFIEGVPAVRDGDVSTLSFSAGTLDIALNGHLLGHVGDPTFARVILSTFIGDHPTVPAVKRALLGEAE